MIPCLEDLDGNHGEKHVIIWLVVSYHSNHISQIGSSPIYGKIKNVPNHQPLILLPKEFQVYQLYGDVESPGTRQEENHEWVNTL